MANPILRSPPVDGQRIGLFGGSFNPPHAGHLAVALTALTRLRLDRVWWLVSPQNPLKDPRDTQDFEERLAATRALARHPRLIVTDIEARLGTRTTAATLHALSPLFERGRFVWVMGADSFAGLHRWNDWRDIPGALPLAVVDRPGWSLKALHSPAARALVRYRLRQADAARLPDCRPPAWVFLTQRQRLESSSAIRAENGASVARMSHLSS
ncbi:MAG: nicotinate-nucleotide adenylyltransferase [Parvibaculaceae bacterium]